MKRHDLYCSDLGFQANRNFFKYKNIDVCDFTRRVKINVWKCEVFFFFFFASEQKIQEPNLAENQRSGFSTRLYFELFLLYFLFLLGTAQCVVLCKHWRIFCHHSKLSLLFKSQSFQLDSLFY